MSMLNETKGQIKHHREIRKGNEVAKSVTLGKLKNR